MAQKKITDLTLRSSFDATCNVPVDDSSQTWRATGQQILDYINSRLVSARIVSTSGDSTSGTETVFIPTVVEQDTDSAYDSLTGIYTCPVDGTYTVTGQINAVDVQGGNYWILSALKNGVKIAKVATQNNTIGNEDNAGLCVTATVPCVAGDELKVTIQNNGATNLTMGAGENWVQFLKA